MLYRLVRPMRRSGSSKPQFIRRIPVEVRARLVGKCINVPIGDETVPVLITNKMETIRLSLRTSDPSEAKIRQAQAATYVERIFNAYRDDELSTLTHKQVVALSGELYRGWAKGMDGVDRIALVYTPEGWVRDDDFDAEHVSEEYAAAAAMVDRWTASGDLDDLEAALGAIVDRLLIHKGIAQVAAFSSNAPHGVRQGLEGWL